MAINARCSKCHTDYKLALRKCPKCGQAKGDKTKFRAVLKDHNGKWFRRTFPDLKTARKAERKVSSEFSEGKYLNIQKAPLFSEAWTLYSKWAKDNKGSWNSDKGRYERHIEAEFSEKPLDKISPKIIEEMISKARARKNRAGKPLAPQTIKHVFNLTRRIFNFAIERDIYNGTNPCIKIKLPRFDNRRMEYLKGDDLKRLLDTLDVWENRRAARLIQFALYTGRRRGELITLTWDRVDFDSRMVFFHGMNTKNGSHQIVPIGNKAKEILVECRTERNSEYVFSNGDGRSYKGIDVIWRRIRKYAEIPGVRFHDLRHTYASHLASSGEVDLYTLQTLLGHKTPTMTQRYAHLLDSTLRDATKVADSVF